MRLLQASIGCGFVCFAEAALSCLRDDPIGLITEVCSNLLMGCKNLCGRQNLLSIAGIVGCDLGGLGAAESTPSDGLFDLLAART